jgi:integrase
MSRPQKDRRVHGPYPARKRWRLIIVEPDGARRRESYETREEAEATKGKVVISDDSPTIMDAVRQYTNHLERKGCKPSSITTSRYRLDSFFGIDQPSGGLAMTNVSRLTPEQCTSLYDEQTRRMSVDTHRSTLTLAKTFGQWCVKQGWMATSPLAAIEPFGRRKRGKEQLRISEARAFLATCESYAWRGDAGAIAAMTLLLLGMRASEVVERVVRDLDDGGRILWIPSSKTEAGRRTLEVPSSLRPHLLRLAKGKQPTDRLFSEKDRQWVYYHVKRMCSKAGVPEVTPHSLRGLHATLATEHGVTGRVVASALGHTSFEGVTKRHYVAPGTTDRVAQKRVELVLGGEPGAGDEQAPEPGEPARQERRRPAIPQEEPLWN